MNEIIGDPECSKCSLSQTTERVCVLSPYQKTEVAIVGEAPGANEARTGKLFSGEAGQLLDRLMAEVGLNRDDCYVMNAASCRPPENRTPTKKEIKACKFWVDYQFSVIKPKYVLILGNTPLFSLLGLKGIRSLRGRPIEKDGVFYLPTYHPAYILRDPTQENTFRADLASFKSIIDFKGVPKENSLNLRIVDSEEVFKEMLEDIENNSMVSYDIETTGLYPWAPGAEITLFGVGTKKTQWSMPLEYPGGPWYGNKKKQKELLEELVTVASGARMCAHNAKFDSLWLLVKYGIKWLADFDTMLAHYILDENSRHGLKELASVFLGAPNYDIDKDQKQGNTPIPKLAHYHAHDLYYTRKLATLFEKKLKEDEALHKVFHDLLMPVARMFVDIEFNGVHIDLEKRKEVEIELHKRLTVSKAKMDKFAPELNWGSPKQVGEFLFGTLGLEPLDKTAGGANSTSESVLKRLAEMHEVPRELMKYREAKQQLSFFVEGWTEWLASTSYLHPGFKIHGTTTGRLSSSSPNLQQVPRDPFIRSQVTAPEGWELIEADLSQIELRIAAELAQEKNMLQSFKVGVDVHWKTVMREFSRTGSNPELVLKTGRILLKNNTADYAKCLEAVNKAGPESCVKIDKTWKEIRKKAKAVNFGFLFSMWWKKFIIYARDNYDVIVSEKEAQEARESFFDLYPAFTVWHRKQIQFVKRHGYVRSLVGRKRRLPAALGHKDTFESKEAQRMAINSPVQSYASDHNLMAALEMHESFHHSYFRIIGTVHDSILMLVKKERVKEIIPKVKKIMSHPRLMDHFGINLSVPIEAEVSIGPWGAGKNEKEYFLED